MVRYNYNNKKKYKIEKRNINQASKDELIPIVGINKHIAEEIIKYRDEHMPLTDINELRNINGLGYSGIEELKRHFTAVKME